MCVCIRDSHDPSAIQMAMLHCSSGVGAVGPGHRQVGQSEGGDYPLVIADIAIENGHL